MPRPALRVAVLALLVVCSTSAAEPPRTWICHFDVRMADESALALRNLLDSVPLDSKVLIGVSGDRDIRLFRLAVALNEGPQPHVEFIDAGASISGWARDRYIVFRRGGRRFIAIPPMEAVERGWSGDVAIARELCRRDPSLTLVETELALEGGNIVLTRRRVLVGIAEVVFNAARLETSEEDVRRRLEALFGRKVVVVGTPDGLLADTHIDMFLSAVTDRTLLLGNPRLALGAADLPELEEFGTFTHRMQNGYRRAYEAIAATLRREGFRVRRIPILHAESGLILTWNNAVVTEEEGTRRAYVPSYGVGELERRAHEAWRDRGLAVVPIAADAVIGLGGAVRCITNTIPEFHREQHAARADGRPAFVERHR